MKKRSVIFSVLVVSLSGCATKGYVDCGPKEAEYKFFYKHPTHGEVLGTDPLYRADYQACRNEVHQRGVMINGKLVRDSEEIKKAGTSMIVDQTKRRIKEMDKAYAGSGANAGISGALAVSGINYTANKPTVKEVPVAPEYADVERANTEIEKCVSNKGWSKPRMEKSCK